jgi:hypothetical protein
MSTSSGSSAVNSHPRTRHAAIVQESRQNRGTVPEAHGDQHDVQDEQHYDVGQFEVAQHRGGDERGENAGRHGIEHSAMSSGGLDGDSIRWRNGLEAGEAPDTLAIASRARSNASGIFL